MSGDIRGLEKAMPNWQGILYCNAYPDLDTKIRMGTIGSQSSRIYYWGLCCDLTSRPVKHPACIQPSREVGGQQKEPWTDLTRRCKDVPSSHELMQFHFVLKSSLPTALFPVLLFSHLTGYPVSQHILVIGCPFTHVCNLV